MNCVRQMQRFTFILKHVVYIVTIMLQRVKCIVLPEILGYETRDMACVGHVLEDKNKTKLYALIGYERGKR